MAGAPYQVVRVWTGANPTDYWDLRGEWRWRDLVRSYRDGQEPPPLEQIRRAWDVQGEVVSPDGSPAGGWAAYQTIRASLDARGTGAPIRAELVLVEVDGTEQILETLGPPDWQGFRVEVVEGPPDDVTPASSWWTTFPLVLRFTAGLLRDSEDDGDTGALVGIVGFEQVVSVRWVSGLREVTWETTVTTREGVDARDKALVVGAIPLDTYGASYTYLTGNSAEGGGVDLEILDSDERTGHDRIPTRVRATSTLRGWGIVVGTTGPGTAPDEISLAEVEEEDEATGETVRSVEVSARGPNARDWGRGRAPASFQRRRERYDRARREFSASWETVLATGVVTTVAKVTVTGGHAEHEWEPVTGGYAPMRFDGPVQVWEATVEIAVTRRGGGGRLVDLPLPPLLADPWVLIENDSSESGAYQAEPARSADKVGWRRDATYVYRASAPPVADPAADLRLRADRTVATLLLPTSAGQGVA